MRTDTVARRLLIIIPLVVGLILVGIFMPARQVTIKGFGTLSFETAINLTVGSEAAYASPANLYEYYNTGDDASSYGGIYGVRWRAQTFTPSVAHKITSVKLKLSRSGNPGTVTVSIRATNGSGHPTGGDLCSGTINGNTLTTNINGEWYEITLGSGYNLSASTKYAIVTRAPIGNSSNYLGWRYDSSSPTYAGGNYEISDDGGSSWSVPPLGVDTADYMFEEWGEAPDISNTPSSKNFGTVVENSDYWSNDSAPTFPLDDGECFFTVTNNGSEPVNISIKATNFSGGVGWTLTSGSPGQNTVRMKAGKSGDALEANMVILTTSNQSFISNLGVSSSKKWELKLETGSFTDNTPKTSTITLTASLA